MSEIPAILLSSIARAPWGWALLATVMLAVIKVWPILALQAIEAKAKIRGEKRDDLSDCKKRLDAVSDELTAMRENFHHLELKLLGAISAFKILDAEVEAKLPGSTALGQARAVMSTAFTLSPSTPGAETAQ